MEIDRSRLHFLTAFGNPAVIYDQKCFVRYKRNNERVYHCTAQRKCLKKRVKCKCQLIIGINRVILKNGHCATVEHPTERVVSLLMRYSASQPCNQTGTSSQVYLRAKNDAIAVFGQETVEKYAMKKVSFKSFLGRKQHKNQKPSDSVLETMPKPMTESAVSRSFLFWNIDSFESTPSPSDFMEQSLVVLDSDNEESSSNPIDLSSSATVKSTWISHPPVPDAHNSKPIVLNSDLCDLESLWSDQNLNFNGCLCHVVPVLPCIFCRLTMSVMHSPKPNPLFDQVLTSDDQ